MFGTLMSKISELGENSGNQSGDSATRRQFLVGGAAAAMTAATAAASAQSRGLGGGLNDLGTIGVKTAPPRNQVGGITSIGGAEADPFAKYWANPTLRLARRISYGVKESELDAIGEMGYQEFLDQQMDWEAIDDSAVETYLNANYPFWKSSIDSMVRGNIVPPSHEVTNTYLHYLAFSNRQFHARMVEFWMDHFHVQMDKPGTRYMTEYVFSTIFPNAASTFRNLLEKVVKAPAMSIYLDNHANRRGNPNINYAREILELHTVGVNGGYTEGDINETAKILTGWVVQKSINYPYHGTVVYQWDKHEPGTKALMGRNFLGKGEGELADLLNFLCDHVETKNHLAVKMYRFFLGRVPTESEKSEYRQVWDNTDGDIKSLMRLVLSEQNIKESRSLYKRPLHLFIGLIRQLNITTVDFRRLDTVYLLQNGHHARQVEHIAEHFAVRFQNQRKSRVARCDGQQIGRSPALLPQRRATRWVSAG